MLNVNLEGQFHIFVVYNRRSRYLFHLKKIYYFCKTLQQKRSFVEFFSISVFLFFKRIVSCFYIFLCQN